MKGRKAGQVRIGLAQQNSGREKSAGTAPAGEAIGWIAAAAVDLIAAPVR